MQKSKLKNLLNLYTTNAHLIYLLHSLGYTIQPCVCVCGCCGVCDIYQVLPKWLQPEVLMLSNFSWNQRVNCNQTHSWLDYIEMIRPKRIMKPESKTLQLSLQWKWPSNVFRYISYCISNCQLSVYFWFSVAWKIEKSGRAPVHKSE